MVFLWWYGCQGGSFFKGWYSNSSAPFVFSVEMAIPILMVGYHFLCAITIALAEIKPDPEMSVSAAFWLFIGKESDACHP